MDNAEIARPHIWTRKKQKDGLNLLDKTSCGARAHDDERLETWRGVLSVARLVTAVLYVIVACPNLS